MNRKNVVDALVHAAHLIAGGDGRRGYVAFYKNKRIEVYADTAYAAQKKAAKLFKARRPYEVTVVLAEEDGKPVSHDPAFLAGSTMYDIDGEMLTKKEMLKRAVAKDVGITRVRGKNRPVYHAIMSTGDNGTDQVFAISKKDFARLRVKDVTTPKQREQVDQYELAKLKESLLKNDMSLAVEFNTWVKNNPGVSTRDKIDYLLGK